MKHVAKHQKDVGRGLLDEVLYPPSAGARAMQIGDDEITHGHIIAQKGSEKRRKTAIVCRLMNHAKNNYEILSDAFDYAVRNWLRLDMTPGAMREATIIHIACAFLLDNLFIKEGAGPELTKIAMEELGTDYDARKLSDMATKIRLSMSGDDFASGKSPLREYLYWIAQDKEEVLEAFKDNAGRLDLVYIDELVTMVCIEHTEVERIRIAEILFLNMTDAITHILKEVLKERYKSLDSYVFFNDIEEEFELIRSRIED